MSFNEFVNGFYDAANQLPDYLRRLAENYFSTEESTKSAIQTVEAFEARKASVRKHFIDAIGGLDIEKTPVNPVCTGEVIRNGYKIKKIILESQPGVYVTTNLYIPDNIHGKAPGVLFACGHGQHAKAHETYQRVCMDLVRNGFIVLIVDCIGQGERSQYFEKAEGRKLINGNVWEHCYTGLQCHLTGSSIARYFVWDLIRAMDYLCSLPEVDTERIGMTGSSGGGTQTSYMMLVDDRIKVAAPCNYITSRLDYMKTGQAHDSEQNIFGAIAEGLNYDDFITGFAPKPVMIGSVESDFFCIEGSLKSYDRAKQVYGLYNCGSNVKHYIAKGTHAFNDELRCVVVNWFRERLKGEKGDFVTQPNMPVEPIKILWCTQCGEVMGEFEGARRIFDLNVEYLKKYKYSPTDDPSVMKKSIAEVLNMPSYKGSIHPRTMWTFSKEDPRRSYIFFFSEPNIVVSGIYIDRPGRKSTICTILLLDEGTNAMEQEALLLEKLLEKGDVFVFNPRGIGGVQSRPVNPKPFYCYYGTEFKLNYDAMMMKRSLLGLKIYDILKAYDYLRQVNPEVEIALAGKGISAVYTLLAAALNDNINNVYLENMISSFEEVVKTKYYPYDPRLEIYGVLRKFDIPLVLEVFKNKNIIHSNTLEKLNT